MTSMSIVYTSENKEPHTFSVHIINIFKNVDKSKHKHLGLSL